MNDIKEKTEKVVDISSYLPEEDVYKRQAYDRASFCRCA